MTIRDVSVPSAPAGLPAVLAPSEAYAQLLPLIEQQKEDELALVNADIPTMTSRMVACETAVQPFIPEAEAKFRDFDPTPFLRIGMVAMALLHAHTMHVTAEAPVADDLPGLTMSGDALFAAMQDAAQYLGRNGLIDPRRLESIKGVVGYRNKATALMSLEQVLRGAGPAVLARCAVTVEDLDKAAAIANRLFAAVAQREQTQVATARTALIRQKAFTLAVNDYDTIRSIVSFLRWKQDDADDFVPSLFANRRTGRREQSKTSTPPAPPAPAGEPTTPTGHTPASPASPHGSEHPVPYGQPGGSPFIS